MPVTEYAYPYPPVDPDNPLATVNPDEFAAEVAAAGLVGYQGLTYDMVTLVVGFDPALSAGDKTTLDGVVAAYGPPNTSPLKLESFLPDPLSADFRSINYATGLNTKLAKLIDTTDDTAWFRGEIRRIEYHATPEHNDKVLQEEREWARNADGTVTVINPAAVWGDPDFRGSRSTWTWFREDGTADPSTKTAIKTYNGMQSMTEGYGRRQGLLNALEAEVLRLLLGTGGTEADGIAYMMKYATQLDNFVRTGDLSFKTPPASPNITDDTEPWLDNDVSGLGYPANTTIRDVILDSLKGIMEP
jgi:hypothetical protein